MTKEFEFYWDDLTPKCQKEFEVFLGGENGNYDVMPIFTFEMEVDEDSEYES